MAQSTLFLPTVLSGMNCVSEAILGGRIAAVEEARLEDRRSDRQLVLVGQDVVVAQDE